LSTKAAAQSATTADLQNAGRGDIEMIGKVRDVIRKGLVERLGITDEQGFYAWIEE